ncbi:hypothetical protein AOG23_07495 [Rhizobium acidisoli]|nr:hypothetical protein AOG23_07495 [Rhizobium acidisoli]
MADRRDNPLARWLLNALLPHHVIIFWENYNSGEHAYHFRQRGEIISSALAIDRSSKFYSASV